MLDEAQRHPDFVVAVAFSRLKLGKDHLTHAPGQKMAVGDRVHLRIGLLVDFAEKTGDLLKLFVALRLAVGQQ